MTLDNKTIAELLNKGNLGVMPTDTQYGLLASALNQKAVKRVYTVRKRSPEKPFIILISSIEDLKLFGIDLNNKPSSIKYLQSIWPNPISVILPCTSNDFSYLHRGTNSLAFRIPKNQVLLEILKETGPLIAPSANTEGQSYAKTIEEAKKYFGDSVDFYKDAGKLESNPSTLIKIEGENIEILRHGSFPTENLLKNLPEVVK
jgi:L-threonylcarbamoyladenylate synthase